MKNIKLMIIALVALLGFNSCSDKFDFNDAKKLVRYTCVNDTNLVFIDRSFEYDAKGHLVSAYEEQNFAEDVYSRGSYTYTWHKKGVDVHGEHAMSGAYMFLTGEWTGAGVFNVEEFNPDPFLKKVAESGLPWHEVINGDLEL